MNRRRVLHLLGMGVAALTLDPERALWVPGKKTFFLPSVRPALAFHPYAFAMAMEPLRYEEFNGGIVRLIGLPVRPQWSVRVDG